MKLSINKFIIVAASFIISLILSSAVCSAQDFSTFKASLSSQKQNDFPSVDKAFTVNAFIKNNQQIQILFESLPNTYVYANSLKFKVNNNNINLSQAQFPEGQMIVDDHYGKTQIFKNNFEIILPYQTINQEKFNLLVEYQGCYKDAICYPPKKVDFDLIALASANSTSSSAINLPEQPIIEAIPTVADQNKAVDLLNHAKVLPIIGGFILFGLLLSLTPCVLPMVPIISGIIAGHKHHMTKRHAFLLSLTYVLGMAITYMIAGILVASLGLNLVSTLQHPVAIITFSILFVILAIASFGFFDLKIPDSISQKLSATERKQKGGTYLGVAIMGALSALIMSPCATAPLAGALLYISSTGNILLGGVALFCMGFAMGTPVLLFGTSAGHWLPKAGPWMKEINIFFGVVFIGLALYLISRILTGPIILILWAFLLIFYAVHLGLLEPAKHGWQRIQKGFALILTIYGCLLLAGATKNNSDVLHPLGTSTDDAGNYLAIKKLDFTPIKTISELTKNLVQAKAANQYTILTFSANWCTSCRYIENNVFTDPKIKSILANFKRLEVDITAFNEQDKNIMTELTVFNPPTIIFYNQQGKEILNSRITSQVDADNFYQLLKSLPS